MADRPLHPLAIDAHTLRLIRATHTDDPALNAACGLNGPVLLTEGTLEEVSQRLAEEAAVSPALARLWALRARWGLAAWGAGDRQTRQLPVVLAHLHRVSDVLTQLLAQGSLRIDQDSEKMALGALADLTSTYEALLAEPEPPKTEERQEEPKAPEEASPAAATSGAALVLELLGEMGPSRAADLARAYARRVGQTTPAPWIARRLRLLYERGEVERLEPGLYALKGVTP